MEKDNDKRTCCDEIQDLLEISKEMLKKEGMIYILDMQVLGTKKIDRAFFADGKRCGENLINLYKEKLYPLVSSCKYRAEQRLFYEQLSIFQGLLPLIDEVIEIYFLRKYISAYFALIPVVEGLLLRLAQKIRKTEYFNLKNFIENKTKEIAEKYSSDMWTKHNIYLLEYIIKNFFFEHSNKDNIETMFNRNVVSHLLNDPNHTNSQKNILCLFTFNRFDSQVFYL